MTFKLTALTALFGTANATNCQTLCESVEKCASDPDAKGSYCKTEESPQTCFGLFYTDETQTTMCFHPNDIECSEMFPVTCPETPKPLTCQDVCSDVESCRDDPQAHGSYCKFEELNPICFGLYYETEAMESICFEPNDSNCAETNPVPCPKEEVTKQQAKAAALAETKSCQEICDTVDSCREDPQAHGSYCKFEESTNPVCFGLYYEGASTTDICFEPNDAACAEVNPVSCPPVEVAVMRSKRASDPEPLSRSCQEICNGVQSCRDDPNTHGSYCKDVGSEQMCFGLYHTDDSKKDVCFQPNDPKCPDTIPVYCPAEEVSKMVSASASDTTVARVELPCKDLCQEIPSCRDDPVAHGSYCKEWLPIPVCFGFYYTTESKEEICFEPNDPSCPEKYPVTC